MIYFKKTITIKTKITLIIFLAAMIMLLAITAVTSSVILPSFEDIEQQNIERDVLRTNAAIQNSLTRLKTASIDWARWDDSYIFIQNSNHEYLDSNLDDSTLVNLGVNYINYVDLQGNIIFSTTIDFETGTTVENEQITEQILKYTKLIHHPYSNHISQGVLSLPEGLLLVVSSPIINSEGNLPQKGSLILGRFIDDEKITEFSELTKLPVEIFDLQKDELPPDVVEAESNLKNGATFVTTNLDKNTLSGYSAINDLNDNQIAIVRMIKSRDIYQGGIRTLKVFIPVTFLAILLISIIINIILEKIVLSRFSFLTKEIEGIISSRDISLRLKVGKSDEIGKFATTVNKLLTNLSSAQETERILQDNEKKAVRDLKSQLIEIEKFNNIMVGRELKMVELKNENEKLRKQVAETSDSNNQEQ